MLCNDLLQKLPGVDTQMVATLFLITLASVCALLLLWSFRNLPGEKWQIMACVPVVKEFSDQWKGVNLTYYGLLTANAYVSAITLLYVLMGSLSIAPLATFSMVLALLLICVPASKQIARIVEKKAHTFTVGGASFLGIVLGPWVIELLNKITVPTLNVNIPLLPALAALSIAYAFGEGLGRLACISFGCCYGKPVSLCHPALRRVFEHWSFIFSGKTKKIAYASNLDGERVIPVQGITAVLYIGTALLGVLLFLNSRFTFSFILTILVTQTWRVLSETLRADYRGAGKISAYQLMSIVAVFYSLSLPFFLDIGLINGPDLTAGLKSVWNPALLIFLQALWVMIFLYVGRSMVTGSTLSIHVIKDRI